MVFSGWPQNNVIHRGETAFNFQEDQPYPSRLLLGWALCLEEMREIRIEEGALWYWQVRKREPVLIDSALRRVTLAAIEGSHKMLASGKTPPPTDNKKRCRACSLVDLCEPDAFRRDHSCEYIEGLFTELTGSNSNEN